MSNPENVKCCQSPNGPYLGNCCSKCPHERAIKIHEGIHPPPVMSEQWTQEVFEAKKKMNLNADEPYPGWARERELIKKEEPAATTDVEEAPEFQYYPWGGL